MLPSLTYYVIDYYVCRIKGLKLKWWMCQYKPTWLPMYISPPTKGMHNLSCKLNIPQVTGDDALPMNLSKYAIIRNLYLQ